jgi:hypothetical protein
MTIAVRAGRTFERESPEGVPQAVEVLEGLAAKAKGAGLL